MTCRSRWRRGTVSVFWALCEENPPITMLSVDIVIQNFATSFVCSLTKLLKEKSSCWWFEMLRPSFDNTMMMNCILTAFPGADGYDRNIPSLCFVSNTHQNGLIHQSGRSPKVVALFLLQTLIAIWYDFFKCMIQSKWYQIIHVLTIIMII